MAAYKFGEIVLVKFPFTDSRTFKKRPALVIKDTDDGDVIVCRITSKPYYTLYDIELKNWSKCGLQLPSVIRIHKITALEIDMIDKKLGEIENNAKTSVISVINQLLQF